MHQLTTQHAGLKFHLVYKAGKHCVTITAGGSRLSHL